MHIRNFAEYGITFCKPEDITGTGAKLDDVSIWLIVMLQKFYVLMCKTYPNIKIILLKNGLTSGDHRATWHPRGLAADIALSGDFKIYDIWKIAVSAGFGGIGLYWNGVAYSIHIDLRPRPKGFPALWAANKVDGKWSYGSVFSDPAGW